MLHLHTYLIAVDGNESTPAFNELIEKFDPRFSLRQGVHVCRHATLLSIDELKQLVKASLPEGIPFFVAIPQEWDFQQRGEPQKGQSPSERQ